MPDKWPLANGNWSNAANWNGGTKPVIGDTVYADGKTLTIDENINIGSGLCTTETRSGGTAGGSFVINNNLTIVANFRAGTTTCISSFGSGVTLTGNIEGSLVSTARSGAANIGNNCVINGNILAGTNSDCYGVANFSSTNVIVNGNIQGGPGGGNSCPGIAAFSGSMVVNGNVLGGTFALNDSLYQNFGINSVSVGANLTVNGNLNSPSSVVGALRISAAAGSCIITVNGNVYAGTQSTNNGIRYASSTNTATVVINGSVYAKGADGINFQGTGTLIVTGDAFGGINGIGVANYSVGGTVRVYGTAVGNDWGLGYASNGGFPGVYGGGINTGVVETVTSVRSVRHGANGQAGISGRVFLDVTDIANSSVKMRGNPSSFTEYTLATAENLGSLPSNSDVRLGTVFNFGTRTGTCAVPPANSVAFGVPVDNTTGTAVITQAGLLTLLQQSLAPNSPIAVERSIDDEKSITFSWPVSGATISGEKSIDNGAYSAVAGGISFLRTESGRHYYTLAYDAADRTNEESTIRYKMTDGTYTRYFNLRLVPPGITPQQIEDQLEDEFNAVNTNVAAVGLAVVDRPTLSEIEASTVLAKESNATSNKEEILIVANDSIEKLNQIQASSDNQDEVIEDLALEETVQNIKSILTSEENPDKVMVNQDFGGADNLMYTLDGEPVADALIELFLYSDYVTGNYNSNRLDSTRQRIDGTWAKAFYLDPQEYVVRFYRTGVAGPDAFKLVVSFDADEIDVTPL